MPIHNNTHILTPLKAADTVALMCPASTCLSPEHPQLTADYLKHTYQLKSVYGPETTQALAAQQRADIFLTYLFDENINALIALRGGEGASDILPYIHQHYDAIKKLSPKLIMGFSDITAILNYFVKHYHWPVLHSSGPLQFIRKITNQRSEQLTMDLLFGNNKPKLENMTALNTAATDNHVIEGELTGGCLSLLEISIKDIWEIDTDNKIIFIEDVAEKPHEISRSLKYLQRIGIFDQVTAVIFGDFNCEAIGDTPDEQKKNHIGIKRTLQDFADQMNVPVLHTQDIGHGQNNVPLLLGVTYQLKLEKNGLKELILIS